MYKEQLPITITPTTHPYAIRLSQAYRPHTPIPSKQELMENEYQLDGHCSLKGITEQCGYDYNKEINSRS